MTDTSPHTSLGKKFRFIVFLVLIVPALLAIAEIAGRTYIAVQDGAWGKSYGLYTSDPVLGHIPAPNRYNHITTLNDGGFRNLEDIIRDKPSGALRLITYGGSTTFAYNLKTAESWPYKLQQILRTELGSPKTQVLNGGVVLWSIGHAYERAKREIPLLTPDYVIIYSGINEEANTVYLEFAGEDMKKNVEAKRYGVVASNYPASSWLHQNSLVFKVLHKLVLVTLKSMLASNAPPLPTRKRIAEATHGGAPSSVPDPYLLENYQHVLRNFIELIKKSGGTPVFVVQSTVDEKTDNNRLVKYSARSADLARELGALVLDSRQMVAAYTGPKSDLFHQSHIHFTDLGSSRFARFVGNAIVEHQRKRLQTK